MAAQTIIGSISGIGSGYSSLIFVQGMKRATLYLDHTPFTIGRKVEEDPLSQIRGFT
jgi:hypothetical protein